MRSQALGVASSSAGIPSARPGWTAPADLKRHALPEAKVESRADHFDSQHLQKLQARLTTIQSALTRTRQDQRASIVSYDAHETRIAVVQRQAACAKECSVECPCCCSDNVLMGGAAAPGVIAGVVVGAKAGLAWGWVFLAGLGCGTASAGVLTLAGALVSLCCDYRAGRKNAELERIRGLQDSLAEKRAGFEESIATLVALENEHLRVLTIVGTLSGPAALPLPLVDLIAGYAGAEMQTPLTVAACDGFSDNEVRLTIADS